MKKSFLVLMVFAMATLLITSCATKEEKVSHEDIKGKKITISTGDWYEACDKWAPGTKVNLEFKSSQPVSFDVHYHMKHKKMYAIEKTTTDSYTGSITVESDAIYCCMWKNDNPKYVTVTYDMSVE